MSQSGIEPLPDPCEGSILTVIILRLLVIQTIFRIS